jgi:hypothetical protein
VHSYNVYGSALNMINKFLIFPWFEGLIQNQTFWIHNIGVKTTFLSTLFFSESLEFYQYVAKEPELSGKVQLYKLILNYIF